MGAGDVIAWRDECDRLWAEAHKAHTEGDLAGRERFAADYLELVAAGPLERSVA